MKKNSIIHLRITEKEKEKFKEVAEDRGFNSLSAFILYVIRREILGRD